MIEKKTFLVVDVVSVIDRRSPVGKKMWEILIDHHCFRGNDTKMVLQDFWECPASRSDEDEFGWNDKDYNVDFPQFIFECIRAQGINPYAHGEILLNICWQNIMICPHCKYTHSWEWTDDGQVEFDGGQGDFFTMTTTMEQKNGTYVDSPKEILEVFGCPSCKILFME